MEQSAYNRIKAALAEQQVSNKQLALHLKIEPETVSRWCTNDSQPTIKTLFKIATFLKVDVRTLLVSTHHFTTSSP